MKTPVEISDYGPVFQALITNDAFSTYGSGKTSAKTVEQLGQLRLKDLFSHRIADKKMAQCCLSGLWLLHNCLDRSHDISQAIKTPEGSFWHAIMHRLEDDFWNSKYWYRNVGQHDVFDSLVEPASKIIIAGSPAHKILTDGRWNAASFVDYCEAGQGKADTIGQQLACLEWQMLFDHCFRGATGT